MRVVFRPQAQRELLEAKTWYEGRSPGLGFEFARAVDAAIAQAARMPLAFQRIEADFRHVLVRKFPYSIIYYPTTAEVIIISCFHHRRRPGAWQSNIEQQNH